MEIFFDGKIFGDITPNGEHEIFKASSESQLRNIIGKRLKELGYPINELDGVQIIRDNNVIAWIGFQQHIKFDDYEITLCGGDTISVKNKNVFLHVTGDGRISSKSMSDLQSENEALKRRISELESE